MSANKFFKTPYAEEPPYHEVASAPQSVISFIYFLLAKIIELMGKIEKLESRLNTNSTNSNIPPSKDPIGFKRKNQDQDQPKSESQTQTQTQTQSQNKSQEQTQSQNKDQPKQARKANHPGTQKPLFPPTAEENVVPTVCPYCGCQHLKNVQEAYTHQYIELPEHPVEVYHLHVFNGTCSQCGHKVSGQLPADKGVYYGPRLCSYIVYLDSSTGMTRRQIQELLLDVYGIKISQGAIQNIIDRASQAIEPHYDQIGEEVRQSLYNHADETSWPTHGPELRSLLHWLWFLGNAFLAFFMIDAHRSAEACKRLFKEWKGILISDDYGTYKSWDKRQSCLAHKMRAAKKCAESADPVEAECGKKLLKFFKRLSNLEGQELTEQIEKSLINTSWRLFTEYGDLPGKAGSLVKDLYINLSDHILFLKEPLASKTNNFAERMIRAAVCQRKISFGSAADKGERWIERSLSVRKSCALNQLSYFKTLVDAIRSFQLHQKPDLQWISKAGAMARNKFEALGRKH